MFTKVEPLTKDQHQDLRFSLIADYKFASQVQSAPIVLSEFAQAAKYYPILFLKDQTPPIVLLSFEKDKNSFVLDNGSWKVPYIPAHFRRYPFVLAKTDAKTDAPGKVDDNGGNSQNKPKSDEEKFVVCIDRDASHFASDQGDLMFTANGEFTELTNKAVNFLKSYQQELIQSLNLVSVLEEKEVLVERQFNLTQNGESRTMGGFRMVDMAKVAALDDSVLADWVRKGIMSVIITHLNSLAGISL